MDKRQFRDTGKEISLLGFGCMRFPVIGDNQAEIDEEKSMALLDRAIEGGVNYFDTAYIYHEGKAEQFVGKALSRYPRESYYLATKMPSPPVKSAEDVPRIFEEQLKNLQTDYFDFYLVHNVSTLSLPKIEGFHYIDFLNQKKREGKIRHLGFSFHDTPEILEKTIKMYDWDFAQLQINYLDWELQNAKRQYEILTENNLPVIVMEPVRGGSLANLSGASAEILKQADPQASAASWAFRFVASLPNVLTVLSGMSTAAQVEDNLKTMSDFQPLAAADYETIERALAEYKKAGAIPCTGCRYCMDCPAGVDIPAVFSIYNEYCFTKSVYIFKENYHVLGKEHQASLCVNCGACVEKCPQGIAIPERMEDVNALLIEK